MHLYLVRHAKAGSRHQWHSDDHRRPLSKKGRRQADGLAKLLADRHIERVLSSPYVRCVETVHPLADKLGLEVEPADSLAEGAKTKEALALVRGLDGVDAVLCSHGDVIPKILDTLADEGHVDLPPDYPYPKASTWELVGQDGRYMKAHYLPPPA